VAGATAGRRDDASRARSAGVTSSDQSTANSTPRAVNRPKLSTGRMLEQTVEVVLGRPEARASLGREADHVLGADAGERGDRAGRTHTT
jgi:hypothetical protein